MVQELAKLFGKNDGVKSLVFTILSNEFPLKIIELTNFIRKRYGKAVTFQAVRKGVNQLLDEEVLVKDGKEYRISADWLRSCRDDLDQVYEKITEKKSTPKSIASIKDEISVFEFETATAAMKFWQDLIEDWFHKFKKGDPNINCYQGAHCWEGLYHLDREKEVMDVLKKKGIVSYALGMTTTPLDLKLWKFYEDIGIITKSISSSGSFDRSYYVATYGEIVVQVHFPQQTVAEMDEYFRKNKGLKSLDLLEFSGIVNRKDVYKMTVIKNLATAQQINASIMAYFED